MNNKLLLRKSINFPLQHIKFLNFLHPNYELVDDISTYDNPNPNGIIYIGTYFEDIYKVINAITDKWIIVSTTRYDLDLSTNEGLVKNLLPLNYIELHNSKTNDSPVYNSVSYESLLEKVKVSLILGTKLSISQNDSQSVYTLFTAILGTPDILSSVFFNLVNSENVDYVTSSILTFLDRVQSNNIRGVSIYYSRLITQSNKRYGKRIKQAIFRFIKSKCNKEVSLYNLLTYLNKAK